LASVSNRDKGRRMQERGLLTSFCRGWTSSSSFSSSSTSSLAFLFHLSFRLYLALFPGLCIYLSVWLIERGESSEAGEMVDLATNLNKYGRTSEEGRRGRVGAAPSETSLRNAWVRTSRRGKFISSSRYRHPLDVPLLRSRRSASTSRKLDRSIMSTSTRTFFSLYPPFENHRQYFFLIENRNFQEILFSLKIIASQYLIWQRRHWWKTLTSFRLTS